MEYLIVLITNNMNQILHHIETFVALLVQNNIMRNSKIEGQMLCGLNISAKHMLLQEKNG
jgi:hypothetical protein